MSLQVTTERCFLCGELTREWDTFELAVGSKFAATPVQVCDDCQRYAVEIAKQKEVR